MITEPGDDYPGTLGSADTDGEGSAQREETLAEVHIVEDNDASLLLVPPKLIELLAQTPHITPARNIQLVANPTDTGQTNGSVGILGPPSGWAGFLRRMLGRAYEAIEKLFDLVRRGIR